MNEALHQEIATLRARNDYLEAEVAALKEVAPGADCVPLQRKFKLTKQQAKLLYVLADGKVKNKGWLCEQIYIKAYEVDKLSDVVVCQVRKKIAPLKITTHWGVGYQLEGESLEAVRGVLGAAA